MTAFPVVVRVRTTDGPMDWSMASRQSEILFNQERAVDGPIQLLDPTTCTVLATSALPQQRGPIAVLSRGVTGEGAWEIVMDVSGPSGDLAFAPNFDGCTGR
jgi:hypothetical protein